ncbi:UvrD-helicase domain-containing protein [Paenibacillus illinoisensis]|uniref:UvrD-helicase domain-containing protein n=1 Tax=Paenibacillus illinoisensis TaxID=59845 RepID=UPI003D26DFB8
MFDVTTGEFTRIQSTLLGQLNRFTDEQLGIIQYDGSGDVVACPGSGKTTVLIAKIALILKAENLNEGICVITHTNVGVEEILKKLSELGIHQVTYPHFIGTIHEFFNTFFALKAYSSFSDNDRIFFMENEEFKGYFSRFFERHKPHRWNFNAPTSAVDRTKLSVMENGEFALEGFEDRDYRNEVLNTFIDMFQSGYLRHSDTISLSQYYVKKYSNGLRKAFEERFKYLFIDEAQDTSVDQYSIISDLLEGNHKTNVQFFGDPYQALYNLYYGEPDAWIPSQENSKEISTSNRFGTNISNILKTVCIQPYPQLVGSETVTSLQPHLFIYKDQTKVLESFCKTIELNQITSPKRKVYAVSQHHLALELYHNPYKKIKIDLKNTSSLADCLKIAYIVLSRRLRKHDRSADGKMRFAANKLDDLLRAQNPVEHGQFRSNLAKVIKTMHLVDEHQTSLNQFSITYERILRDCFDINIEGKSTKDSAQISKLIQSSFQKHNDTHDLQDINTYKHNETLVHLNTVHGVKGETHLATLLLESPIRRSEGSDLTDILPFLFGIHDSDLAKNMTIKDTLKLAYVALSRPTDFMGVAIKEAHITEAHMSMATQHGWKIVRVDESH